MSETSKLRLHTQISPDVTMRSDAAEESGEAARRAEIKALKAKKHRRARIHQPMNRGDRLLRNSAIACSLLLGILALGNLETPWAKKASESVERALTMHIDLDESIGALQFVKNIMPESALVFMNTSAEGKLAMPVEGQITHRWSNSQPWLMFSCASGSDARVVAGGTVTAVSALSGGRVGLLVDHSDGRESLYASLNDACVRTGDTVEGGQVIGHTTDSLYFEYRNAGESIDPAPALGL